MATGVITNRLLDPSGTALSGVVVNARLKPTPTGFRTGTFYEVSQLESTTTDASGDWSLSLEINGDILPGDSYWEIEEAIPASAGVPRIWSVQVASGSHTLYASLVSVPPSVSVPSYLTQSSADARYLQVGQFSAGSGISITNSVVSVVNLTNSNATAGYLFTITSANTATATVAQGQLRYSSNSTAVFLFDGQNWLGQTPRSAYVAAAQTTTQTAYVALPTAGPSVTIFTGGTVTVLVSCRADQASSADINFMGVAVSGATTVSAADTQAGLFQAWTNNAAGQISANLYLTGLTPGLNTFTAMYRTNGGGQGTWRNRTITVIPSN